MTVSGGFVYYYDVDDNKFYGIYNKHESYPEYLGKVLLKHFNKYNSVKTLIRSGNTQGIHLKAIKDGFGDRSYIKDVDVEIFKFDSLDDIKSFKAKYDYLYVFKDNEWKCYDKFLNFKEISI